MVGGHGHVRPRPDGIKARCGGPALCATCAFESAEVGLPTRPGAQFVGAFETTGAAQAALNDIVAGRLDGGLWPTRDSGEDC